MFLNNQCITKGIKRNLKNARNKWQWKHDDSNLLDSSKVVLRRKYIAIQSYLKKQKKKSNRKPKFIPNTTGKRRAHTHTHTHTHTNK